MTVVTYRDANRADIPWLVERHDKLYRTEAGFDASFAPVVEAALEAFFDARVQGVERAFIPVEAHRDLGSLFLTKAPEAGVAQLRLFWLEPVWRGRGLGRAMLEQALEHARSAGFGAVLVRTYDRHADAGRLYASAGFRCVSEEPATAFGQSMIEQAWRRGL